VRYEFSNILGVPQLGLSETLNAKVDGASASGSFIYIGYFLKDWPS
jgi:hypothetical protein